MYIFHMAHKGGLGSELNSKWWIVVRFDLVDYH
jgi:hypothetical protein